MKESLINYFLSVAEVTATRSKDPSRKIGVIIVNPKYNTIISTGYNGFCRGFNDSKTLYEDKEYKYLRISHAEANAITNACKVGVSTDGCFMFVHGLDVCNECAKLIIQSGIIGVYVYKTDNSEKWINSNKISLELFKECGVFYKNIEQ